MRAAAWYFCARATARGPPLDAVARFHLGNGARLERINLLADTSDRGAGAGARPDGELPIRSRRHREEPRSLCRGRTVVASSAVQRLLRAAARAGAGGLGFSVSNVRFRALAFGSKTDMTFCAGSAFDPKRTWVGSFRVRLCVVTMPVLSLGGRNETARLITLIVGGTAVAWPLVARATLSVAGYWAYRQWIGPAEHPHNSGISRRPRRNRLCCRSERQDRISLGRWPIRSTARVGSRSRRPWHSCPGRFRSADSASRKISNRDHPNRLLHRRRSCETGTLCKL